MRCCCATWGASMKRGIRSARWRALLPRAAGTICAAKASGWPWPGVTWAFRSAESKSGRTRCYRVRPFESWKRGDTNSDSDLAILRYRPRRAGSETREPLLRTAAVAAAGTANADRAGVVESAGHVGAVALAAVDRLAAVGTGADDAGAATLRAAIRNKLAGAEVPRKVDKILGNRRRGGKAGGQGTSGARHPDAARHHLNLLLKPLPALRGQLMSRM